MLFVEFWTRLLTEVAERRLGWAMVRRLVLLDHLAGTQQRPTSHRLRWPSDRRPSAHQLNIIDQTDKLLHR